jgi:TPR repeat protein
VGQAYAEGDGVRENAAEAAKWFRLAADQDSAAGEYELGKCYLQGKGMPKDLTEGVRWTRRSAEQGYALAQNSLGLCYANGTGLGKDNLQAYKWFNLAAAGDDEHADDTKVSMGLVERFLAPEQISEAQRMAREFKPRLRGSAADSGSSTNNVAGASANSSDPGTGVVVVNANDETCEIYLDGSFVGNAPARLKLTAGSHVLEVKKEGYADSRKEIMVSAGSELTLRAKLEKKP